MGSDPLKVPACRHCGSTTSVKLCRQYTVSGTLQIGYWCVHCERWAKKGAQFIKHNLVSERLEQQGATINDLEIVNDYRSNDHRCIICGKPAQNHHWAPQALKEQFGEEWHLWPKDQLCEHHHRQWHDIVTPYLSGRKRDEEPLLDQTLS